MPDFSFRSFVSSEEAGDSSGGVLDPRDEWWTRERAFLVSTFRADRKGGMEARLKSAKYASLCHYEMTGVWWYDVSTDAIMKGLREGNGGFAETNFRPPYADDKLPPSSPPRRRRPRHRSESPPAATPQPASHPAGTSQSPPPSVSAGSSQSPPPALPAGSPQHQYVPNQPNPSGPSFAAGGFPEPVALPQATNAGLPANLYLPGVDSPFAAWPPSSSLGQPAEDPMGMSVGMGLDTEDQLFGCPMPTSFQDWLNSLDPEFSHGQAGVNIFDIELRGDIYSGVAGVVDPAGLTAHLEN
ncbi:uncharacterized protein GIQ15_00806 [Arthroderma uncinatum]|uniref:uncharacterized protein n=1 Tax=Arthroderma uncinatum TaxID=74035 RepID=UPI00144ABF38|nr:uncharacterized protein GIQ15_00806 [Arthroderma uncinatum]KAF3491289.1 hypothetical protein GIQ15_00806 [Arthroderma uncinatum]